jgi:hypothetical protein
MAFACLCGLSSRAADATAVTLSDRTEERTEYERLKQRFLDRRNSDLLNAAGWTLAHGADENEVKKAESILKGLTAFGAQGVFEQLDRRGGVKTFKNEVASLLKSADPTMRGFAAITLAVFADPNYTKDIAALLERKSSPDKNEDGPVDNFDRSRAAMALGLLGAKEYTAQIAELLKSRDSQERSVPPWGSIHGTGNRLMASQSCCWMTTIVLNAAAQLLVVPRLISTIAKLRHRGRSECL